VAKRASLGSAIRTARERAGLSQSELARELGVPQGTIGRIESGGRGQPRFQTVAGIARVLGASLDALAVDAGLLPALTPAREQTVRLAEARLAGKVRAARRALADADADLATLLEGTTRRDPG
jgi:transcriptional regulator with XRE-family HTH domain